MMKNLVSILMPCKNAEMYLKQTLQSIENQTFKQIELILVDDFSTDKSHQILTAFKAKNLIKIKVFKNQKPGIINALKLAYKNCSGNFVTRMDADDLMEHNKIELLLRTLIKAGKGFLATSKIKYFANENFKLKDGYKKYESWLNGLMEKENNFTEIYKECVIPSPNWMMHKIDFDRVGAFNFETYPEDYDLCFRMYQHNIKIVTVKKVLHFWRDYAERTSRTDENYADNNFLNLKVNYFLQLDFNKSKNLMLWGVGKKGKQIAKLLQNRNTNFDWLSNNKNKIGVNIYDKIIKNFECLKNFENNNIQIIIAVAGNENQKEIAEFLKAQNMLKSETFWFC